MNGWLGWTTEEWSALAALVAAGGAVGTLLVAIVAALAAFRQVREARTLRQEQAQPYVAVFMEPSAATPRIIQGVRDAGCVRWVETGPSEGSHAFQEVRSHLVPRVG